MSAAMSDAMRRGCAWLAAVFAMGAAPVLASEVASEPATQSPAEEVWYAATAQQGRGGFLFTHYWSKGPRLRAETVLAGHRIVTIVSGDRYCAFDAVSGEGVLIKRHPRAVAADATRGRPFGVTVEMIVAEGGEKVGEELRGQTSTDVYRVTGDRGRRKVWFSQTAPPLPLRTETFVRAKALTETTDYISWERELVIPDAFFEPPARIALKTFEYDEYLLRAKDEPIGPVPVLYGPLLHGERE